MFNIFNIKGQLFYYLYLLAIFVGVAFGLLAFGAGFVAAVGAVFLSRISRISLLHRNAGLMFIRILGIVF
jgi:hypothetical protein